MNENTTPGGVKTLASQAATQHPALSTDRLCRDLSAMTRQLRGRYTTANAGDSRSPVEEWLCDNYYQLEKESKQSIRDIRFLSKTGNRRELEQLYHVFWQVIATAMPPVCDETVSRIIEAMDAVSTVGDKQFSFIPAALKAVFVRMAYRACVETGKEEEIAYAIVGIGKLTSLDLQEVIRKCSGVERILMEDPAGVYPHMCDDSRQYYRRLISIIAIKTGRKEQDVAGKMLELAKNQTDPQQRHIGFGIVGHPCVKGPRRMRGKAAVALGVALPLVAAALLGWWARSLAVAVLTYLPLWEILRTLIQQAAMAGVDVDYIPRMDLSKIAHKPKTVVLVSTLLPKASDAPALASRLEQLYYSNSDPDMYYCILADFKEWDYPTDEKDESQIAAASKVVELLNRRYQNRFLFFLRARTYNRTQNRYSGWERKRGAITEFIRFLKGEQTSVHTFVGDRSILPDIRYIIALDADTSMLYESAQTLVSAAIHPLNRPVVGEEGVVTRGYGILVPKISTDLESAKATAFSRVLSGCGGVTAYDTRDKDFYQDLFGDSIFAGKGLIDVDCFYALLDNRFPENRVLSHDILEGSYLRTAFVSDVEMTDTAPTSMVSWLSRLHRWLRGDWQNLPFTAARYRVGGKVYQNPIGNLAKFKLFDNLRRSLTPVAALFCVVAALMAPPRASLALALTGVLAVTFSSLWSAVWSMVNGGFFTLSRKFFTRTLPHTFELMGQGLFFLIMMPVQAFVTLDAVCRSLWRTCVSGKKMLEWTTAAQGDMQRSSFLAVLRRYWLAELFGLLFLLASHRSPLCVLGILFVLVAPLACFSARSTQEDRHRLSGSDRDTLLSYNAAMWRYYEEFANGENHYLPPDNIQQSPVFRVANRTSPTNIGMLLLSTLAARDFDFIDTAGLYLRLERTVSTIEKLPTWHGNLYNWYDTLTLDTLKPEFVSTVDSGNFVCCLVALVEGMREYIPEKREFADLILRVESIIQQTDLAVFYDKRKKLFSIGWDVPTEQLSGSYYDFLMSEARLTSYYAVARKIVSKKHWGTLGRTMSRSGSYAGPVSWTGTMFEYFMPHLLLPVYEGSLLGESLSYCLYCQKRRVRAQNVPWGISESAFYAFDNNLNYQYKAHGVQKLGVKRYLDRELVISPYSTFITIPHNPNSSMENLRALRELGVYGRYGFYEAVDFTAARVGKGGLAVTRSYMAHHIGMSMVASCNALFQNRMQNRFMRDPHMKSAGEFLQEKIAKNTVVYDKLRHTEGRDEKHERPRIKEEQRDIYPQAPQCALLTNGEITDILTDTGAGYLKFGAIDLTRRSADLLRRSQGVFTVVKTHRATLSATKAPFYDSEATYLVEHQEECVTYYAKKRDLEVGVRCLIHPTISCQQRQIVVKNKSSQKQTANVLVYLEPVLGYHMDYSAHPAYSKLFVTARYDRDSKTITYTRRGRDSTSDIFLTVGLLQDLDFSFETRREQLMRSPNGLEDLLHVTGKQFSCSGGGVPDACCALWLELPLGAGGQGQVTVLLSAARTEAEGIRNIISMRKQGVLDPKNAARSPLLGDSLEARLGGGILGQLLFTGKNSAGREERGRNSLGQSALWCTGISGDLPIALLETPREADQNTLEGYLRLHADMRRLQVEYDLVILCDSPEQQDQILTVVDLVSNRNILGVRGGIFLLDKNTLDPEIAGLIRSVARHTAGSPLEMDGEAPFQPMGIQPVQPAPMPGLELAVGGGGFREGRFYVDKQSSPLPWSHPLANSQFGTLVSDNCLGYTWALNSRENKLTPWYNDICTDNSGELCLLREGEGCFDLVRGARASFCKAEALYQGKCAGLETQVQVTVSETGCAKYVEVLLRNRTERTRNLECAYYLEPVLGVNRDTARHIRMAAADGALLMHNPYNTAVQCHAALALEGERPKQINDRRAFLSGDWKNGEIQPQEDPCAALVLPFSLEPRGEKRLRFVLTYGKTAESALHQANIPPVPAVEWENTVQIETPDKALDQFINHFASHQIKASRLFGRCAFYQCGGAYGFRDQLQDVGGYLLLNPALTRRQIVRCCSVQFEEGDVLHWWHNLPKSAGGLKGVRTRFSDDLLWLPLAVCDYVEKTGDRSILAVPVGYLRAPVLLDHEHEKYLSPERSELREDVYRHCVRALEKGHNLGENGLPLMGCGDWNDGMSAVGIGGKGTSVWLALFLSMVLERFAALCGEQGDPHLEEKYRGWSASLKESVDRHCWDGEWYVRAFFDDGDPMGSKTSHDCNIDLLPQSFAVLAGMPDRQRVDTGLQNAWDKLADHNLRLVRLFTPAFRDSPKQPGYVKAYPPGIRENGGQYTHSAIWFALALIQWGKVDEGWHVLEMLNPVDRATRGELAGRYRLEPYYMPADIYTNENAPGRGGWSMYTGAVSWYYRAVLETVLGLTLRGHRLELRPHLPPHWPEAALRARIRDTYLDILLSRDLPAGMRVDGRPADAIPLDGGEHRVEMGVG